MTELSRERIVVVLSGAFIAGFLLVAAYWGYVGAFARSNSTLHTPQSTPSVDLSSLTWTIATSSAPFGPRDAHAMAVFQSKVWLIGGLNGEPARVRPEYIEYWRAEHRSDIWVSEDAVSWTLVTNAAPWGPERSLELEEFQGSLWLFGGWSPIGGYHTYYWKTEDGVHWQKIMTTTAPPPREGAPIVAFQNKLWMFGGVNFDTRQSLHDVWFSADGITWNQATTTIPWAGRYDHAVAEFNGKLWLTGGVDLNGKIYADEWVSDDGIHWTQVMPQADLWTERHGHVMLVWQDALWMIGGWTNAVSGAGESWFTKDGIQWTKAPIGAWKQREDHAVSVFRDALVLTGGMDTDWHWNGDVWMGAVNQR